MKRMIKWERGDRVTRDGRVGSVGLMGEPYCTNILPEGAPSWVLRWWVRWDAQDGDPSGGWLSLEWGSDLSLAPLDDLIGDDL